MTSRCSLADNRANYHGSQPEILYFAPPSSETQ
jgi:hypothetical protein